MTNFASTGVPGLDEILTGGLPREHLYLIQGGVGTGKTTMAMQFLLEGARKGEKVALITFLQSRKDLEFLAESHGWNLSNIEIHELSAAIEAQKQETEQTIFRTTDVELNMITDSICDIIGKINPDRLVLDSISEMRVLSTSPHRFRQQILYIRQFLSDKSCTSLFTIDKRHDDAGIDIIVNGIIELEQIAPSYGMTRRQLSIQKLRGVDFRGGYHDLRIKKGGCEIYPRLATNDISEKSMETIASNIEEFDSILGGGLETGTSCMIQGPTGVGKTLLSTLFAYGAARQGYKVVYFLFDESEITFYWRARQIGMDIKELSEKGLFEVIRVRVGNITLGEFSLLVRNSIEKGRARIVVLDSLSGYLSAMPQQQDTLSQTHELLGYLKDKGLLTLLTVTQFQGQVSLNPSFLVDSTILLRYYESKGEIHRALTVLKKRYSQHESSIRPIAVTSQGVKIGNPLTEFEGDIIGEQSFI